MHLDFATRTMFDLIIWYCNCSSLFAFGIMAFGVASSLLPAGASVKSLSPANTCVCVKHLKRCKTSYRFVLLFFLILFQSAGECDMIVGPHSTKLPQSWDTGSDQPSVPAISISALQVSCQWQPAKPRTGKSIRFSFLFSTVVAIWHLILLFYLEFSCIRTFFRART